MDEKIVMHCFSNFFVLWHTIDKHIMLQLSFFLYVRFCDFGYKTDSENVIQTFPEENCTIICHHIIVQCGICRGGRGDFWTLLTDSPPNWSTLDVARGSLMLSLIYLSNLFRMMKQLKVFAFPLLI